MRKGETRKIVETVLARKGLALTIYPTALTGAGSQLLDLLLQIPPIRGYRIGAGHRRATRAEPRGDEKRARWNGIAQLHPTAEGAG